MKLSTLERDIRRVEVLIERRTSVPQTCLYRSLARYAILKRAGHSARFVLGIRKSGVDGGGHAWVEVDEQPFSERESPEQYAVTFRYPLPSRSGKVEE